ncbi:MAG: ABC transporter substrate-binding protein [Rhodospirillaceae bacterium]|nr:ABC transporter substrate-binding protein [Rhodospirillaceae bacterium]
MRYFDSAPLIGLFGALVAFAAVSLVGCGQQDPVRIAYLGGLSGRVADLGSAGRDGMQFAVDEANEQGGVEGRKVEIVVRDDGQDPNLARAAVEALIKEKPAVIIGPMTSSIAEAVLPQLAAAELVAISPTVASSAFSGKADMFFRVAPTVPEDSARSAAYQLKRGFRSVSIAFDIRNRTYSEDWAKHFAASFEKLGGTVKLQVEFASGDEGTYRKATQSLIESAPDSYVLVANAVDTAQLVQLLLMSGPARPMVATSWAATEDLLKLGGRNIEGLVVSQFFDRGDVSPRYDAFSRKFQARYGRAPGYPSVAAYDASRAALAALARSFKDRIPLHKALLVAGPYQGLQENWNFDAYGDAKRTLKLTVVDGGHFQVVD